MPVHAVPKKEVRVGDETVGEVPKTRTPEPVSSETAVMRFAELTSSVVMVTTLVTSESELSRSASVRVLTKFFVASVATKREPVKEEMFKFVVVAFVVVPLVTVRLVMVELAVPTKPPVKAMIVEVETAVEPNAGAKVKGKVWLPAAPAQEKVPVSPMS